MVRWIVVFMVVSLAATPVNAQVPVTAFVDVSVIPMDREHVLPAQTVLVRGDRIVEIGPVAKVRVPNGALRIDGRKQFLIPGLGDMHTHVHAHFSRGPAADSVLFERMLFLYAANGVTTIRNMQDTYIPLRTRAAAGTLWSPRIYTSGHKLFSQGFSSQGNDSVVNILSPAAAAAAVAREKAAGYDFLKIYDLKSETFDSVVAAARRLGIPFSGHVPPGIPLERALEAGYRSIEHLTGYMSKLRGASTDSSVMAELVAATKRAGVWNTPTYTVHQNFTIGADSLRRRPEMKYISDQRINLWRNEVAGMAGQGRQELQTRAKLMKALYDGGAGLLLATDSPDAFGVPGFSIHWELEALVSEVGLTPYQALETGTRNIAAFFGTLDSTGTIAVGKRADLVLLTGNPLADIRNTAIPAGVMIGGQWRSRADIETGLAALEKTIH